MGYRVFGNQNILAMTKMSPRMSQLGITTQYTKPSLEPFYSHYGFALPLTFDTVPLNTVLDDDFPFDSDHISLYHPLRRYLLIDHKGALWKVIVTADDNNELDFNYAKIHKGLGWWITDGSKGFIQSEDADLLLGFLYTDPSPEEIEVYWAKYCTGRDLVWLDINAIVAKLNLEFPPRPKRAKLNDIQKRTKIGLNKMIDELIKEKVPGEKEVNTDIA